MRLRTLLISSLSLLPLTAGAQNDGIVSRARSLWFSSDNAAGLVYSPLEDFSVAMLDYGRESGSYHLKQQGESVGALSFNSQSAVRVGKVHLWGHFSYRNAMDKGTQYNTLVYDPSDELFLYGVADTTVSNWKRQAYLMEFKAAAPIVKDRLSAGLQLSYTDKIASKQNDPRSESFNYHIELYPSLTWRFAEAHVLGLAGFYSNAMERSVPTLSDTEFNRTVYMLRGLGNYNLESVGSGGVQTMFFRINSAGGYLQYSWGSSAFVQAGMKYSISELTHSATLPRPLGQSAIMDFFSDGSFMILGKDIHKLSYSALYRSTSGTEYSTKTVAGEGWQIADKSVMSNYSTFDASARYDCFLMDGGNDWKWNISADAEFAMKSDMYLAPVSEYRWSQASANLSAIRNFKLRGSSIKAGISLSSIIGLGGAYSYSGAHPDSPLATDWYPSDLAIRQASMFGGSFSVDYGLPIRDMEIHLFGTAGTLQGNFSRNIFSAGLHLVF